MKEQQITPYHNDGFNIPKQLFTSIQNLDSFCRSCSSPALGAVSHGMRRLPG